MRIGNDVVDLNDKQTAAAHLRPRFVARVCNAAECARVEAAADPAGLLWSLFAAKEAAFKAVSKQRPSIVFAHRQFEVAEDLRSVRYKDLSLDLRIDRDGDRIHAVALLGDAGAVVDAVEQVGVGADLSIAVRELLRQRVSDELGCAPDQLGVERTPAPGSWTGSGPPWLTRDGARTDTDISLSHDGRFVAFAALRVNAAELVADA